MKLTRSVSYGVGVLLQIESIAADRPLTATEIGHGCRFPPRFLYRILRRLVAAGLLRGTSGPGGGYRLARAADRITLLAIVKAVQAAPRATVLRPASARHRRPIAAINRISQKSARQFSDELRGVSLAQLARGGAVLKRSARRGSK